MRLAAVIVGAFVLDLVVVELPDAVHPVAWFGRVVGLADREWRRPLLVGGLLALALPVLAAVAVGAGVTAVGGSSSVVGLTLGAVVLFVTTSYRSLLLTVRRVATSVDADLDAARRDLRALAGRDAAALDAGQVRSAALESLAENLADGLVGPLLAFALAAVAATLLGLSAAPTLGVACAGAVWLKAVNTMDSMWGYPDTPLGTGAARLDDVAMWLPARVTAALLALAFVAPGSLRPTARWVDGVASPNAGWPMGVLAAALTVRLEKPGHYVLNPDADLPGPDDVRRGLHRVSIAGLLAYVLAGVLAWS